MASGMTGEMGPSFYAGLRILVDPSLVRVVEDWSGVRSPSRARRRLKRGFRQRIQYRSEPSPDAYRINGALVMHPEMAGELMARLVRMNP